MTRPALPDWRDSLPWPGAETHKHARGRLGVVSGKATQTGAARLAARAGLRIGAGLVRILCPPEAASVIAPAIEAIMLTPFGSPEALAEAAEGVDAVVVGPAAGVDEITQANVRALAVTGAALVVDADALTVFRERPDDLFDVLDKDDVLTPHPGEFERLFPGLLAAGPTRIDAARAAAIRAGAVVLLKGADTVIAAPDGRALVNDNAPPWLATAGSGDVLAGIIGAHLTQGMPPFEAAASAVWRHGEAGRAAGEGLTAEDIVNALSGLSEIG